MIYLQLNQCIPKLINENYPVTRMECLMYPLYEFFEPNKVPKQRKTVKIPNIFSSAGTTTTYARRTKNNIR